MAVVTVIPARLASHRLPGKMLALIAGKPLVRHVVERALAADVGPVLAAVDDPSIADALAGTSADIVMTDANIVSGSDRVYAALSTRHTLNDNDQILNIQGDMPFVEPSLIRTVASAASLAEIVTAVAPLRETGDKDNPDIVKAVLGIGPSGGYGYSSPVGQGAVRQALYFSRAAIPSGTTDGYEHIGIYLWQFDALRRFVKCPTSALEKAERLEQLRAMEMAMNIDAVVVDRAPISVDNAADLEKVREIAAGRQEPKGRAVKKRAIQRSL